MVPPVPPGQQMYVEELSPVVHIAIGIVRASFGISTENALARIVIAAVRRESSVEGIALHLLTDPDSVEELMGAKPRPQV